MSLSSDCLVFPLNHHESPSSRSLPFVVAKPETSPVARLVEDQTFATLPLAAITSKSNIIKYQNQGFIQICCLGKSPKSESSLSEFDQVKISV